MAKYASPESGDLGPWCVGGNHMPSDIVHQIVTFLPERDICSLEICSRFWHALCSSDLVWFHLFRKRWASSAPSHVVSSYLKNLQQESPEKRICDCALDEPCSYHCLYKLPHENWQAAYRNFHVELGRRARAMVEMVNLRTRHKSVEVADYQKGLLLLSTTGLGHYDILLFLLNPAQSVLINLIGLHYCLFHLGIQGADMRELLARSKVGDRQVWLRWWSIGGWANGFRRRDEMHVRTASMYEMTDPERMSLFHVLDRGTLHEVLRVQISADFGSSAWVQRDMHAHC